MDCDREVIISKARELLKPGFLKGTLAKDGLYCSRGALLKAMDEPEENLEKGFTFCRRETRKCLAECEDVIVKAARIPPTGELFYEGEALVFWNNAEQRTREEVLEAFSAGLATLH